MNVALETDATLQSKESLANKALTPTSDTAVAKQINQEEDADMADVTNPAVTESSHLKSGRELLYRCLTCKRLAHYRCLPPPSSDSNDLGSVAEHYQSTTEWHCPDCFSYSYDLDKIIAWRPYPPEATEPSLSPNEPLYWKRLLPREYLVKWKDRSYRRVQWVPHMWLVSTHPILLKKFLENGPRIELLAETRDREDLDGGPASIFEITEDDGGDSSTKAEAQILELSSGPLPDAERRIPSAWKTVSRVLDVLLWHPQKRRSQRKTSRKGKKNGGRKRKHIVESEEEPSGDSDDEETREKLDADYAGVFEDGEQPPEDLTETLEEYEDRTGESMQTQDIDRVIWVFVKWDDLGYEEGCSILCYAATKLTL